MFVEGQWVGWTETLDLSGIVRAQHDPADFAPTTGGVAAFLALRAEEARHAAAITVADGRQRPAWPSSSCASSR